VIIADSLGYWMGRLGGHRVFSRVGIGQRWTPGMTTVVFGRFVIGARVVLAPMAGTRRLPFGRFLVCDAFGAAIWATAYVLIGYGAGANLGSLQYQWASATAVIQIALTIAIVAFATVKFLRARWLRIAVGAALLAVFSLRAITLVTEELQPGAAEGQAQLGLL